MNDYLHLELAKERAAVLRREAEQHRLAGIALNGKEESDNTGRKRHGLLRRVLPA